LFVCHQEIYKNTTCWLVLLNFNLDNLDPSKFLIWVGYKRQLFKICKTQNLWSLCIVDIWSNLEKFRQKLNCMWFKCFNNRINKFVHGQIFILTSNSVSSILIYITEYNWVKGVKILPIAKHHTHSGRGNLPRPPPTWHTKNEIKWENLEQYCAMQYDLNDNQNTYQHEIVKVFWSRPFDHNRFGWQRRYY